MSPCRGGVQEKGERNRAPSAPLWCLQTVLFWHLRRGIVRPRLVLGLLLLVWSAVLWLGLAHLLHAWPLAQAAPLPIGMSVWSTPTPVSM